MPAPTETRLIEIDGRAQFVQQSIQLEGLFNEMVRALAELGVPSDTSMANFILARFSTQEEAEACDAFLQAQGLIVRRVAGYKLPQCLRITIGDEASCRQVAHAVAQFKGVK